MVSAAVKAFGRLDGAFNNAGIANRPAEIGELELADWTRPMSIDLLGAWLCMKYELEVMLRQGGGAIVNTASNAGKHAVPNLAVYGAAKYGLISITKTSAVEYATRHIRVNVGGPGITATTPIPQARGNGMDFRKTS